MKLKLGKKDQNGSVIVSILIVTILLSTFVYGLIVLANSNLTRARGRVFLLQAQYAAESGADVAVAQLNANNLAFTGSAGEVTLLSNGNLYRSTYTVSIAEGLDNKEKIITATGRVYAPASASTANFSRTIEVVAQRSSTTTTAGMLSRNIIDVDSGVKTIKGRDIFLNGYINMNKNTTTLVAENITVADKNTGAGRCSIGGTGNLQKPTTFTNPGQTRTKLLLAYNNCVSPPGNTSNADFEVLANQNIIGKVQSTYIPWNAYMDASYQNSPTGCADWTTGAFPRSIPSVGNTKKTHYPDSANNISNTCGTNGDLALSNGTYTLRDHIHIRANLCAAAACTPTFNNPDSGPTALKFVFIEGSVNFDGVQTSPGSGPIVFVVYGADPVSKTNVCPLGGAIYLGNNTTTSAPALYLLANNGVCLDKTRFGTELALGGLSGKNLYVSTNPGTPFDLGIDPSFPAGSIPVDLAWRAVRYRRM